MREPKRNPPTDLRRHRARTDRDLVLGGVGVVLVVGGALIYLLWGLSTMLAAFACFAGIVVLGLVLWLVLRLIEWAGADPG